MKFGEEYRDLPPEIPAILSVVAEFSKWNPSTRILRVLEDLSKEK
jgi:hypothetical protein